MKILIDKNKKIRLKNYLVMLDEIPIEELELVKPDYNLTKEQKVSLLLDIFNNNKLLIISILNRGYYLDNSEEKTTLSGIEELYQIWCKN